MKFLLTESLQSTRTGLGGFDFTVARRSLCFKCVNQPSGNLRCVAYSSPERGFVYFRGLGEAAELSYKLQACGSNFFICCGRIKIEKCLDVPAHDSSSKLIAGRMLMPVESADIFID